MLKPLLAIQFKFPLKNDLMSVTKEGDIKKLKDDGFEIVPENSGLITVNMF